MTTRIEKEFLKIASSMGGRALPQLPSFHLALLSAMLWINLHQWHGRRRASKLVGAI